MLYQEADDKFRNSINCKICVFLMYDQVRQVQLQHTATSIMQSVASSKCK